MAKTAERDRLWCASIVATQRDRDGRKVCDVEQLLRNFNSRRDRGSLAARSGNEVLTELEAVAHRWHQPSGSFSYYDGPDPKGPRERSLDLTSLPAAQDLLAERDKRIAELEAEIGTLRACRSSDQAATGRNAQ